MLMLNKPSHTQLAELIQQVRTKTGAGVMEVKKALYISNYDVQKTINVIQTNSRTCMLIDYDRKI